MKMSDVLLQMSLRSDLAVISRVRLESCTALESCDKSNSCSSFVVPSLWRDTRKTKVLTYSL